MTMSIRFWGTRGSFPALGPEFARYGGDTSCVVVECAGRRLILDAGTGLARYGRRLPGAVDADVFLTHAHLDHIIGLAYFAPIWRERTKLRLWMDAAGAADLTAALHRQFSPPFHPVPLADVPADLSYPTFRSGEAFWLSPGVRITPAPLEHPGGAIGFRVDCEGASIVYGTDTGALAGGARAAALAWARDADLLVLDATFTCAESGARPGWGHMSWTEAVAFGVETGAARIALFHHGPERTDAELDEIARGARAISERAFVAHDDLCLSLAAGAAAQTRPRPIP